MSSFHEKVSLCLENIVEFSNLINEVHNFDDIFKCDLDFWEVKMFSDELYSYIHSKRSPCLARKFFLGLCKKCPQGFNDFFFLIARNKKSF